MPGPNPNTPEAWDDEWKRIPDYHLRGYRQPVFSIIWQRLPPEARILDVGGGMSAFSHRAIKRGHKPFVIDFSPLALETMAEMGIPGALCDVLGWDGQIFGEFDAVVCTELLEHLFRPQAALDLIVAHVDWAFFSVPNGTNHHREVAFHVRSYGTRGLRELLEPYFTSVGVRVVGNSIYAEARGRR